MNGANWFSYCTNDPVNYLDQTGKDPTPSQLFWAILAGTCAVTAAGLGLFGAVATGAALLMLGVGMLMQMGPIGVQIATTIVDGLTKGAFTTVGFVVILLLSAEAAVCAILCLWDDTADINECFGYGPHQQIGGDGGGANQGGGDKGGGDTLPSGFHLHGH